MDSDNEFEALAYEAGTRWGQLDGDYGYQELEGAIAGLYRSRLEFPSDWTEGQREDFIGERAFRDAHEIGTRFDDLVDTVTDRLVRDCFFDRGARPLNEDIAFEITAARRDAINDLRWRIVDEIPEAITEADREGADDLAD
ncbi:hypothetical protein PP327_23385 [Mycobacteroides abscessus]|uniref:hypothetical protein n=1 Tax=Mycobacteroides abscessus TaxID=36809 RepID=UPI0007F96CB0|nr:hypothetical protein [Mycobacteroides abscessus]ANO13122.1 hypothetical protein BAB77_03990 [Mycobacteroides abscessus]MDM2050825.1 hypothetical protein [Mycobacteroides abscessus]MDM2055431.1 hypothetical protein [Mycobacteroides abscessus]MDM2060031.1 hypothetical protein [Mycobacteroides abscessus]MDM2064625.1 hypothetical protein [Mycobacteroides abscessus]